ncbi:pseudouridine synthase [Calocera cornea HHB12733]|uniref:Pseudouridine synthase n=1 Tax=Calocera cornea HHB12733 TaxID=1353952 RepID=A0A165KAX6_9BASI|nr:pseudouridine synthase [Calocera cornea HHB12733]
MDSSIGQIRPREEEEEEPSKKPRLDAPADPAVAVESLIPSGQVTATPVLEALVEPAPLPGVTSAEAPASLVVEGEITMESVLASAEKVSTPVLTALVEPSPAPGEPTPASRYTTESLHPPSLKILLGILPTPKEPEPAREPEVGIACYLSSGLGRVEGIIKQRFTDFLVFEVNLKGETVRVKDIGPPQKEAPAPKPAEPAESQTEEPAADGEPESAEAEAKEPEKPVTVTYEWTAETKEKLAPYFGKEELEGLERMYREGKKPPMVSDGGWEGRRLLHPEGEGRGDEATETKGGEGGEKEESKEVAEAPTEDAKEETQAEEEKGGRRNGRDRKDRGGRGGRDRGRGRGGGRDGGRGGGRRSDPRQPIVSKEGRTELHKAVRELFGGQLETETVESKEKGEGSSIRVKWNHNARGGGQRGGRGGRGGGRGDRGERESMGQYIHFTLQKTNRDSHDALQYIGRMLKCTAKDLMICGTKDKRGVTCQRVCLKRFNRTVQDVWRGVNAVGRRRTEQDALTSRGERGVRISDLAYSRSHLDLGMLKGNEFVITLRNVKVDNLNTIDAAMSSLKEKGFINYYGMQRFGTSPVPTHATGLAILHSDWKRACDLLLMPRPGEDPDCERARRAWLERHDAAQALVFMPRRVVAESCILEYYRDHGASNHLDALMKIPRNLRLMYIHAYQSYVWNAMVSERIKRYGSDSPIVGDLVYDVPGAAPKAAAPDAADGAVEEGMDFDLAEEQAASKGGRPSRQKVKVLTEDDVPNYTIFDVIMPLPGFNVQMPGGEFGELYKQFLEADGLTMESFSKPQKEFSLAGSYRKILHMPKNISWTTMRYTDPNLPLAQTDEDKILGFDEPVIDPDGKFLALQIQLTLGPAAYATMALREVTKTETSSQFQSALTQASEDQAYKGTRDVVEDTTLEPAAGDLGIEGERTGIELEPVPMELDAE